MVDIPSESRKTSLFPTLIYLYSHISCLISLEITFLYAAFKYLVEVRDIFCQIKNVSFAYIFIDSGRSTGSRRDEEICLHEREKNTRCTRTNLNWLQKKSTNRTNGSLLGKLENINLIPDFFPYSILLDGLVCVRTCSFHKIIKDYIFYITHKAKGEKKEYCAYQNIRRLRYFICFIASSKKRQMNLLPHPRLSCAKILLPIPRINFYCYAIRT